MPTKSLKNKHHVCEICFDCIHDCACEKPIWFPCGDQDCACADQPEKPVEGLK